MEQTHQCSGSQQSEYVVKRSNNYYCSSSKISYIDIFFIVWLIQDSGLFIVWLIQDSGFFIVWLIQDSGLFIV